MSQDRHQNGAYEWSRESSSTLNLSPKLSLRPLNIWGQKGQILGSLLFLPGLGGIGSCQVVSQSPWQVTRMPPFLCSLSFLAQILVGNADLGTPYAVQGQPSFGCVPFCFVHRLIRESRQLLRGDGPIR